MRIAYITADAGIPVFGNKGASNHVREFTWALASLGHEVTLLAARLGEPAGSLPCRIVPVDTAAAPEGLPDALRTEVACLARNAEFRAALERLHAEKPFDLIYERYSLWNYGGFDFAAARDLPFVLEVNSPLRQEQKRYRELHLQDAARAIELMLFRDASLLVGVSRNVVDYAVAQSRRRLPALALPNGVDLSLFSLGKPRFAGNRFTLGFVGSLKPWHGLETLLEAFRALAEDAAYELLLVGDGPMRGWIEEFARRHALTGRIRLTGGVEKGRIPELLGQVDVAVAPYPAMDDFYFSPLKLFEYMAAGCAIVASRIGQIAEVVRNGQTALLTQPGNPEELAAAVRRLRADERLRKRLGRAARDEAFYTHGWESRVQMVFQTLSEQGITRAEAVHHANS